MHKNRFLLSVIALIGISLLTINFVNFDNNIVNNPNMQEIGKPDIIDLSAQADRKQKQSIFEKPIMQVIVLPESNELAFDSDPVVDSTVIIKNNRTCYRVIGFNKNPDIRQRFEQRLDKKQLQYYQDYKEYCQKLNQQHPEYSLSDLNKIQKQKKNAVANSYWGQIIKGEIDPNSLNNFEISSLLKQNSLNVLSQAPNIFENYFLKVVHWELEDVLQSHQYDYVNHIRHYAHQLYLCELGAECNSNSSVMAMLCFLNSRSCGLNYTDYVNNILSAGQQGDIQLAMRYLQNKFQ